jgi:uncharacterized protein YndB with AHSA1/START domain
MTNPVTITAPEGLPFIEIEREFDAPVEAVFRAHADPELYARWIGPDGYGVEIERHDFRTGGGYRFLNVDGDRTYAFRGVFHVVRENELVVQTFEYEGVPDTVGLGYLTFERLDGERTRLREHSVYPSIEARDGMIDSGMERGVTQGYAKLDGLVAKAV